MHVLTRNKRLNTNRLFLGVFVILLSAVSVLLSACHKQSANSQPVTELRYQSIPGLVTLPELAEDLGYLAPLKLKYVGSVQGGPQDLQALATGDVDVASAFNGAILKVVAANVDIESVIGSYGSDHQAWVGYFVADNSSIKTARDFIGKKVAVNALGAHYEFALKDYLARNGLTPAEIQKVELVVLPPANSEQALRAGLVDVASLSFIFRDKAVARGGLRQVFADTDMYGDFTAGSYAVTKKFAKEHPEEVRQFVSGTARAIEWARNTPRDQVIARFTDIIHKRKRNETTDLLQYWRSFAVAEKGGVLTPQQFQPWIDQMVKSGQLKPNQIDPNSFIDNQFNPYSTNAGAVHAPSAGVHS